MTIEKNATVVNLPRSFKETTLGELGDNLPLGIQLSDGSLAKAISSMPWKTKHERAIGTLKKEGQNVAHHASIIISQLYTNIGDKVFTPETKQAEKQLAIGQMFMPDILYMFVLLRKKVISKDLKMNMTCAACRHKFLFVADLDSLVVHTCERTEQISWVYHLIDPITIRSKKVTKFRMMPPKWFQIENAVNTGAGSEASKIVIAKSCVVGFNDEIDLSQLMDSEMDEVSKIDLEGMLREINKDFLGPKMTLEGTCDACNTPFISMIDWRGDSFFSNSSL